AGFGNTCARKIDSTLWCWGFNYDGQLGNGMLGGPACTGGVCQPLPVQVSALGTTVVEVATSTIGRHTCARTVAGTLWCWGKNDWGQLGNGTTTNSPSPVQINALGTNVVEVAVGGSHTCARKSDNSLWCWGINEDGELGNG